MMNLVGWVVFGLVAGLLARALRPGPDGMGLISTILLGVMGSVLGGGIAYMLRLGTTPYQPAGWIFSILGAVILLSMGFFSTRARSIH